MFSNLQRQATLFATLVVLQFSPSYSSAQTALELPRYSCRVIAKGQGNVGWALDPNGVVAGQAAREPVVWRAGHSKPLPLPPGIDNAVIKSINSSGVIAGNAWIDGGYRAVIWRGGRFVASPGSGRAHMLAVGLNDPGAVAGVIFDVASTRKQAVVWERGATRFLPAPASWSSVAESINDRGTVAGCVLAAYANDSPKACIWDSQHRLHVVNVPGSIAAEFRSVNANGDAVGQYTAAFDGMMRAFAYAGDRILPLPSLDGFANSDAEAINGNGVIVGRSYDADSDGHVASRAAVWFGGSAYDLNTLTNLPRGMSLEDAVAINDNGAILCDTLDGGAVVLLTPRSAY